jgi:hypothetical protein
MMADDYRHSLAACDLNPVMMQIESGRVCTVDTLFVVDRDFLARQHAGEGTEK